MMLMTATGTEYSSTMPHTICGDEPNSQVPSAQASAGMRTDETARMESIGTGRRKASATWSNVLPRAPWNVMTANNSDTTASTRESGLGASTPSATHVSDSGAMWNAMADPICR